MRVNKRRKSLIRYINENINVCEKDLKIDILNQIAIDYGQEVIWDSNHGCSILFSEINTKILIDIKEMIEKDLSQHLICFKNID